MKPLFSCSAVVLEEAHLEMHRGVTLFCVTGFLGFATLQALILARWGYIGGEVACCGVNLVLTVVFGWFAAKRVAQPMRRGRLRLFPDELVFELWLHRGGEVRIPLRQIERLGRNRNRIHIRLREDRVFFFFDCSRLHAEDMYDQITARLDELGVEVVAFERQR